MDVRFASLGDASIAYRTFGDGPNDLLVFLGEYVPVDAVDEEPRSARAIKRLASFSRVIVFNRRGVGLSDPPDGPVTLEQHVEDAVAVLDDAGSLGAAVFGSNVGGPAAIQFAAAHAERTTALIIANTAARYTQASDYPIGFPEKVFLATAEATTATGPSEFDFLSSFAPSVADDELFRAWWDRAGHRGASPGRSRQFWRLLATLDVREDLARITAPTLVMARSGVMSAEITRYIADHIAGARYVEFPGTDLIWWVGDADSYLDEIERFLAATVGSSALPRRALATVLFVDVVESTQRAVALGDRRWREVLTTYHELVGRELARWGGMRANTAGDGFVATFDIPADAVRCARSIAGSVRALEIDVRAGVHTGEIEMVGADVAGLGVHIAARVMAAAGPGEVLVSRTVTDLVIGSDLRFGDRGEQELKGVPGRWQLFVLTP